MSGYALNVGTNELEECRRELEKLKKEYECYQQITCHVIAKLGTDAMLEKQHNEDFLDHLAVRIRNGLYDTLCFENAPVIAKNIWPGEEEICSFYVEIIKKIQLIIQERLTVEWAENRAQ